MTTSRRGSTSSPEPATSVEIDRRTWLAWREARRRAAMWEEHATRLRGKLEEQIGDAEAGTIDDMVVIVWKETTKPRKFNQAEFAKAHPALYEEFREFTKAPRPFTQSDHADEIDPDEKGKP